MLFATLHATFRGFYLIPISLFFTHTRKITNFHLKPQQRPGANVRQPAPENRQPAAAAEPQVEEPPSPTSSTSSSQLQREIAEELGTPQVPKAAPSVPGSSSQKPPVAGLSTQKSAGASLSTQKSNLTPETTNQSAPAEAEAPKQIEAAPSSSSSAKENGNPPTPTKEPIMEESIRFTRAKLRKTRSAGTR